VPVFCTDSTLPKLLPTAALPKAMLDAVQIDPDVVVVTHQRHQVATAVAVAWPM